MRPGVDSRYVLSSELGDNGERGQVCLVGNIRGIQSC